MEEEQLYPLDLMQEEQLAYEHALAAEARLQAQIVAEENAADNQGELVSDYDDSSLEEVVFLESESEQDLSEEESEQESYASLYDQCEAATKRFKVSQVVLSKALDVLITASDAHELYKEELERIESKLAAHPVSQACDQHVKEQQKALALQEENIMRSLQPKVVKPRFFKPQTKQQAFQTMCEVLGQDADTLPLKHR